jgi:hypothetical protein
VRGIFQGEDEGLREELEQAMDEAEVERIRALAKTLPVLPSAAESSDDSDDDHASEDDDGEYQTPPGFKSTRRCPILDKTLEGTSIMFRYMNGWYYGVVTEFMSRGRTNNFKVHNCLAFGAVIPLHTLSIQTTLVS